MSNSIQSFLAKSKKDSNTAKVTPGTYKSQVVRVKMDTRYHNEVILISYKLEAGEKLFEFEERFVKDARFARTVNFFKYLFENGINDEEDFVGCHEELEIRWNFMPNGAKVPTVENRVFLGREASPSESIAGKEAPDA